MVDESSEKPLNRVTSPFDAIRHLDGEREFWRARELSSALLEEGSITMDRERRKLLRHLALLPIQAFGLVKDVLLV